MVLLKLNPKELKTQEGSGKIIFTRQNIEKLEEFPKGPLIELIQGDIFLGPSPSTLHQQVSANLEFSIRKYLKDQSEKERIGTLFDAPTDVILSEESIVIPDLVFIAESNEHIIKEKAIEGVPDLIIEVLSINREYDLQYKKDLYESFGIQEYWIIDPVNKSLEIFSYENSKKKYSAARKLNGKDIIRSQVLLDFEINLGEIFP